MERREWAPLYRAAAVAAWLAVFVFRRNLGAELTLLGSFGVAGIPAAPPVDAAGWFALLQAQPLVGLTLLQVFDLVEYALVGLMFLAVAVALWRANRSAALIALTAGMVGISVYFASNQAFALLALSRTYGAANEAQRAALLAAGEGLLAVNEGGTGVLLAMLLVPVAGLIFSAVMLRGDVFTRPTGIVGLLANGIVLTYFVALPFAPALLALPFALSAPLRVAWYFMIGLRLFKQSSGVVTVG